MPESIDRLLEIMARLRGPQGCPWDREQTLETLRTYLLEESHEVREAMLSGDAQALREELGDLLFQIVFQCRIAEERGWFDFASVVEGISEKLVRRHPHVFGGVTLATSSEVVRQWEDLKDRERRRNGVTSRLTGVPGDLPALLRAVRVSEKAARVGFDWKDARSVFEKVREELEEWEQSSARQDRDETERELGDLLFSLANAARKQGLDPEEALQRANDRFRDRFRRMERILESEGNRPEEASSARFEELWEEAKRMEREV